MRLQRLLGRRPEGAGAQPDRPGRRVNLDQTGQPAEVEADGSPQAARLDAAGDAGAATERHHRYGGTAGPVEQVGDVLLRLGPQHQVGHVDQLAADPPDQVAVGPADAVPGSVDRVVRPQMRQRLRERPRASKQLLVGCWRLRRLHLDAGGRRDEGCELGQRVRGGLVRRGAPSPDGIAAHGASTVIDNRLPTAAAASRAAVSGVAASTTRAPSGSDSPGAGTARTDSPDATRGGQSLRLVGAHGEHVDPVTGVQQAGGRRVGKANGCGDPADRRGPGARSRPGGHRSAPRRCGPGRPAPARPRRRLTRVLRRARPHAARR